MALLSEHRVCTRCVMDTSDPEIVFDTPLEARWEQAIRSLGIDPAMLFATQGVN